MISNHFYIGVVSLATRLYRLIPAELRRQFDDDGAPMARLARDFNSQETTLRMIPNGETWMLEERGREDAEQVEQEGASDGLAE